MFLKKATIDQDRFPTRDAYPFNLEIFQRPVSLEFNTPVTIFTGENGTGKSTLLTALCRKCNIYMWEGTYRQRCTTNPYENMLDRALRIEWRNGTVPGSFFSPELFRHFSQLVDEWEASSPGLMEYFGGKSLMTQSHGQSCLSYFRARFRIQGIHFLDEPEAALSPASQLEFLKIITEMGEAGTAQFIISTHSPIIMSCNKAVIYNFDGNSIDRISYKETPHYRVYKKFFSDK
ncbi:MAG: AAA family ATPase [Deltaproteobacteria bacterium]|nr:AAA family ATPase [Deltaproteobacteria bacterium]